MTFRPDGGLDRGFGAGGVATLPYLVTRIAAQRDGRVVVAQIAPCPARTRRPRLAVRRLTARGTRDVTFHGRAVPIGDPGSLLEGLAVRLDRGGRILLATALLRRDGTGPLALARLSAGR